MEKMMKGVMVTTTTTTMVIFSLICLLLCSSLVSAFPAAAINLRSTNNRDFVRNSNSDNGMHLADGILRDLMMLTSDKNGDDKLSAGEISWFYRNVVLYPAYVAQTYGDSFISIADTNNDGLLDGDELLRMLVEMNASTTTRRR